MIHHAPPSRPSHLGGQRRVRDEHVDLLGEGPGEALGIDRVDLARRLLEGHEEPGLAVVDDLDDAAGRRGDDRRLARHRLEVDDPQRLVDRRAGEHGRVAEQLDDVGLGEHLIDPEDPVAALLQALNAGRHLGADLRRVRRAGAQHELRGGVEVRGPRAAGEARPSGA